MMETSLLEFLKNFIPSLNGFETSLVPADEHGTLSVNAVDLKYVLRKINAYRDNFVHRRLLFPCGS